MPQAPSLGKTSFVVIWSFIVVRVVWTRMSSFYNDAMVAAANVVLPADLWLEALGRNTLTVNHFLDGQTYRHGIDSLVLHSGLLIVLALVYIWRTSCRKRDRAMVPVRTPAFSLFVVEVRDR